jgi:hypothetical protein
VVGIIFGVGAFGNFVGARRQTIFVGMGILLRLNPHP